MKYYRNDKEVSKEEMLSQLKEEQRPAPILSGPNAQAVIEAGKRKLESTTYTITEHDTGQKYTITEQPKQKQEKSTDELIAEARSLIEYNNRHKQEPKQEPTKTKFEKELEQSTKQWREYYRNNPSKIRYNIFEEIEHAFDY